MNHSILHVFNNEEKFSIPYFKFLQSNAFDLSTHTLFQYSKKTDNYKELGLSVVFSSYFSLFKNIKLLILMFKSDKIILHNLASPWLLLYLYLFPLLCKKTYWVIWGKDLYYYKQLNKPKFYHKIYEYFRKKTFKKIANIISSFKGDYQLSKQWYGTQAQFYECFMYPSNLFKDNKIQSPPNKQVKILIGNSADPSNNHFKIFEIIKSMDFLKAQLYTPLSYGNKKHAQNVVEEGNNIFGKHFIPLTEFMQFNDYLKFLSSIDIAIFAHDRQQAVGNIVTMLGYGKKVYLKRNTSHYNYFVEHGIKLFELNSFNFEPISLEDANKNISIIKKLFSKNVLKSQLEEIIYG